MVESIGKKLLQARQSRSLTLEEAAMETRIRASQLAALEADDYSGFANNTYARGFLLMYGKFLKVDVRAFARELETGNPISVADYQYLNAHSDDEVRTPSRKSNSARMPHDERRRPSLIPLVVFIILMGIVAFGSYLYMEARRLEIATTPSTGNPAPTASEPEATKVAIPVPTPAPASTTAGPATSLRSIVQPTPPPFSATPAPAAAVDPARTTVPTIAVPATPVPNFRTDPTTGGAVQNELTIEPLKKTWVRIRRDDPTAEPVFEDVVYPKVGPLKLKGSRFWVEVKEADAVAIRKNGQPLAYQPPGISIQ